MAAKSLKPKKKKRSMVKKIDSNLRLTQIHAQSFFFPTLFSYFSCNMNKQIVQFKNKNCIRKEKPRNNYYQQKLGVKISYVF